ncbi:MAG: hypothetical protein HQM10_07025 [Candidatus Riflebacteria bacterium]|nr:hypothetical protein [Candidatus Riflebacteria bacterium]
MSKLLSGSHLLMKILAFYGFFMVFLNPFFQTENWFQSSSTFLIVPSAVVYFVYIFFSFFASLTYLGFLKDCFFDLILYLPLMILTYGTVHPAQVILLREATVFFRSYIEKNTLAHLANAMTERPSRLIALGFLGVILLGTLLLLLPVSMTSSSKPSFITALFTSTSAVCVTGLNVIDPGTYYTFFGQLVIVALIQVGGIGIMALSAGVMIILGRKFAIGQKSLFQNALDVSDAESMFESLRAIFFWTFAIELTGATILAYRFFVLLNCGLARAVYLGFFHSVSAFCNAGFALFPDNLMSFAKDPVVNLTIMSLIICGGLGFTVIPVFPALLRGKRKAAPDIHFNLVVITTICLILVGGLGIFILEINGTAMSGLSLSEKLMASFFKSVTARTAGFNTIDAGLMKPASLFLIIILMFIGASPGSTGGGIKTTTFAAMVLTFIAQLKSENEVHVFGRSLSRDTVLKAFLITGISGCLVAGFTLCLLVIEDKPMISILFEVVSAFATVGLSTGITSSLQPASQLFLILLMYIGRIGPLTWALSFINTSQQGEVCYPAGRILIG